MTTTTDSVSISQGVSSPSGDRHGREDSKTGQSDGQFGPSRSHGSIGSVGSNGEQVDDDGDNDGDGDGENERTKKRRITRAYVGDSRE